MLDAPASPTLAQRTGGTPATELPGVALNEEAGQSAAVPTRIWAVGEAAPPGWGLPPLGADEVVVNDALARDCGVRAGDWLVLTADVAALKPEMGLFTFRRSAELRQTLRLRVRAVAEPGGWGDFTLAQSQSTPRNAFVAMAAMQGGLPNRVLNTPSSPPAGSVELADLGLRVRKAGDLQLLQSSAVAFTGPQLARIGAGRRMLAVHIAQEIRSGTGVASYSVVVSDSAGTLKLDEVVLNEVLAGQLSVKAGDLVTLAMLLARPDGTFGTRGLNLKVARVEPIGQGLFVPEVTTEIEGMTSADRLDQWQAPFPVEMSRISPADDAYWEQYRATPKALIADAVMQELWKASGFEGERAATSIVVDGATGEDLVQASISADPQWTPINVRAAALQAGQGSSDFAGLFIAMSMFMVVGATVAAAGIARTAMESRLMELGLAEALGLDRRQWQRWVMVEQAVIAVPAAVLGVALGALYAGGMLRLFAALSADVWEMPPLVLDVRWPVVIAGLGMAAAVLAIARWQVRRVLRRPVRELLGSVSEDAHHDRRRQPGRWRIVAGLLTACAAVALARAGRLQIGAAYFAASAGVLVACWALFGRLIRWRLPWRGRLALLIRTALSQPRRMLLTFAVFAVASLVLCSVALYRAGDVGGDTANPRGAAGGVALRLTLPAEHRVDLSTAEGLRHAGIDRTLPPSVRLYGLTSSGGTEGGCLNLARPTEMQVFGVSAGMIARGGFTVHAERTIASPWALLEAEEEIIPVFGDEETMQWIEHRRVGEVFETPIGGRPTRVRLAGVIRGGLFSGQLLMSEANFRRVLPGQAFYRVYLIDAAREDLPAVRDLLKPLLSEGALLEGTDRILAQVGSVQRLYMTMFLVLGSLGLLLGGAGVLTAVVRDATQRRGELALMQAAGLGSMRIAMLLAAGHILPVVAGLGAGCTSACAGYLATGLELRVGPAVLLPAALAAVVGAAIYVLSRWAQPRQPAIALRGEG